MPGPAPKPTARRRNARPDWRTLPAQGYEGDVPEWPIGKPSVAQSVLWLDLWRTPQAVAWADLGWTRVVARYARLVLASERPNATGVLLSEVRQMEDRLGLSPMSMKRLQWNVGPVVQEDAGATDNVVALFG